MDWTALLMPGEFLARRYDSNYLEFALRAKKRGEVAKVGVVLEYSFAVMVGLVSGLLSFLWPVIVVFTAYPFVVIGEPWVWRKYYGKIANSVGVKGAFLANLDIIYLFTIGVFDWVADALSRNEKILIMISAFVIGFLMDAYL